MISNSEHKIEQTPKSEDRYFKLLETICEIVGWCVIVISLSAFAALIAFLLYLFIKGNTGIVIACTIFVLGAITSIIYASYIWRTKGTVNFISNSSWESNITRSNHK
jgi:hypothetical protein